MTPRSPDTEPWAEELQFALLRQAGPLRRLELAGQLTSMSWNIARAAYDRLYPNETQEERDLRFLSQIYGSELARQFMTNRREKCGEAARKASA